MAVPTHALVLYQMRLLIAAELLGALTAFGGSAVGSNHLMISLNVDTTETIASPIAYGRLVKHHMGEKALSRPETAIGDGYVASFRTSGNAKFRLPAVEERNPRPAAVKNPPAVPKNPPPADPPARQTRRWNRRQPAAASPPLAVVRRLPAHALRKVALLLPHVGTLGASIPPPPMFHLNRDHREASGPVYRKAVF